MGKEIFIEFRDEALERVIQRRFYQNNKKITKTDMESIDVLYVPDFNIKDLSGIEYATNLEYLSLIGSCINNTTNINLIASLTKLTSLELVGDGQGTHDISPFRRLSNLKTLEINFFNTKDYSCLSNLPLKDLYIGVECIGKLFKPLTQNARIQLNSLLDNYMKKNILSPVYCDFIRAYLYSPSRQTAFEALWQTPLAYAFVGNEFDGECLSDVFSEVFAAGPIRKVYLRKMLELKVFGESGANIIDKAGNAKAKKVAFDILLNK